LLCALLLPDVYIFFVSPLKLLFFWWRSPIPLATSSMANALIMPQDSQGVQPSSLFHLQYLFVWIFVANNDFNCFFTIFGYFIGSFWLIRYECRKAFSFSLLPGLDCLLDIFQRKSMEAIFKTAFRVSVTSWSCWATKWAKSIPWFHQYIFFYTIGLVLDLLFAFFPQFSWAPRIKQLPSSFFVISKSLFISWPTLDVFIRCNVGSNRQ